MVYFCYKKLSLKYFFLITVEVPSITALNKSGLKILFTWEKSKEQLDTVNMTMTAYNSLSSTMTDFLFQAAVPRVKYTKNLFIFQLIRFINQLYCIFFRLFKYKCFLLPEQLFRPRVK